MSFAQYYLPYIIFDHSHILPIHPMRHEAIIFK